MRDFGALHLKGLADPVTTFEVAWEPLQNTQDELVRVPLPSRLASSPSTGVIGRTMEGVALSDALKRVLSASVHEAVLISGEPGMGKTTLAAQLARQAYEQGALVLLGRCDQDLDLPYGPFTEALSHYVAHASDESLWAYVEVYGEHIGQLVPALGSRLGSTTLVVNTDPDIQRHRLFQSVVGLFAELTKTQPVVLVLDDLQWVDSASLQLIRHLVMTLEGGALLIIGTYRSSELPATHPLNDTLVTLRREMAVEVIRLDGLGPDEVISYVEAAAGRTIVNSELAMAHALYDETDGNPFFLGEVLRHLIETHAVSQDSSGRWFAEKQLTRTVLPESVRQVVLSRVNALGDTARTILPAAAVVGREFDLDLLAAITAPTEDELVDSLDEACAAALVLESPKSPGQYRFYPHVGPTCPGGASGSRPPRPGPPPDCHRTRGAKLTGINVGRL